MANEGERETKRLRSSEPDLQVVLGSGEDEVTRWYHSPTLASKSKYIDTMLSTPMLESDARKITFPDIGSDTWDKMMKFLDSPVAVRKMTERDAVEVAVFYDKYEFEEGTKLCDQLLLEYFKSTQSMEINLSLDVDLVVDSLVIAKEANLFCAMKRGVRYVWKKMHCEDTPYGPTMFTEGHMKRLASVLLHAFAPENKARFGYGIRMSVRGMDDCLCPYEDTVYNRLTYGSNILCQALKLDSPDFAKAYVSSCTQRLEEVVLHRCIKKIEISGAGVADGSYQKSNQFVHECYHYHGRTESVNWGQNSVQFVVTKLWNRDNNRFKRLHIHARDWAIIAFNSPRYPPEPIDVVEGRAVEKCCWIAPCSINLNFPPRNGWKAVDSLAKVHPHPKITYILNDRL